MASIENKVVVIQNPEYSDLNSCETVSANISYRQDITHGIQTLSSNSADLSGSDKGILYVPDLDKTDYCYNTSRRYVPRNVTRQQNLPKTDYNLVAIAPWFDSNCTLSYLAAARLDPIRAFIFYLPNYGDDDPPPVSSVEWDLKDQGHWRSVNKFPIYAVSASYGREMMGNLSLYSGNMTELPNGHILADEFGAQNYARIRTVIHSGGSGLPGLWLFLLVVIGALAVSVMSTSFAMHMLQRKRRASLRRRITDGEVDLEALGIKRLTVPIDVINKMPLYLYACHNISTTSIATPDLGNLTIQAQEATSAPQYVEPSNSIFSQAPEINKSSVVENSRRDSVFSHEHIRYFQPACPICLDDFISHQTVIRELHCGHIFHPDCVDGFLSNNSSLCPMCKKSVLPRGYCPDTITNAMVRRERQLRRLRSRVPSYEDEISASTWTYRIKRWGDALGRTVLRTPRPVTLPSRVSTADAMIVTINDSSELDHSSGGRFSRHEIMQYRVQQLLAGPVTLDDLDRHERPSTWRRTLRTIFPR